MTLPWIKLPISYFDDVRFTMLTDSERWLYIKLLIIAGKEDREGWLPYEYDLSKILQAVRQFSGHRLEVLKTAHLVEDAVFLGEPFYNFGVPRMRIVDWDKVGWVNNKLSCVPGWGDIRTCVLERDGYRCGYCGSYATHVDHIVPRILGGSDELDNLVAACEYCNCSKGGRTPEQAGMKLLRGREDAEVR